MNRKKPNSGRAHKRASSRPTTCSPGELEDFPNLHRAGNRPWIRAQIRVIEGTLRNRLKILPFDMKRAQGCGLAEIGDQFGDLVRCVPVGFTDRLRQCPLSFGVDCSIPTHDGR